jgi:hypothetical protein
LLAALGSLGVVIGSGVAMVLVFFAAFAEGPRSVPRLAVYFGVAGAVLVLAAVLAALGATSLVSAPLPAFLVALLLATLPLLAGVGGSLVFPYASWERIPLAGLAALALILAMPVASWLADTRGEPAGRGRRLRASLVLGGGLVFSMLAFALLAPFIVRAGAPTASFTVHASSAGRIALVTAERGLRVQSRRLNAAVANGPAGFVLDLATGREQGFFPPEVHGATWDPTGTKLAIVDSARPLGGIGPARLRFVSPAGEDLWPAMQEPDDLAVRQVAWAGDRLAVLYDEIQKPRVHVAVIEPATGRKTNVLESAGAPWFTALHQTRDGRIFLSSAEVAVGDDGVVDKLDVGDAPWSLRPLDPARGRLHAPVLAGRGPGFPEPGLSPSGRFWVRWNRTASEVLEVGSGRVLPVPLRQRPVWLADDSLAWLDRGHDGWVLYRMKPGETPVRWGMGIERTALLEVSPDGLAVLVDAALGGRRRALVFEGAMSRAPREIAPLPRFRIDKIHWAGPRTLAVTGWHRLALHDLDSGTSTVVFGGR